MNADSYQVCQYVNNTVTYCIKISTLLLFHLLILGVEIGAPDSTEKAISYTSINAVFDSNVRRPRSAATLEIPVSNEVMGK